MAKQERWVVVSKNEDGSFLLNFDLREGDEIIKNYQAHVTKLFLNLGRGYIEVDEKMGNDYWNILE